MKLAPELAPLVEAFKDVCAYCGVDAEDFPAFVNARAAVLKAQDAAEAANAEPAEVAA